ncbi:hypothetical protein [Mesorhizobium sp. M0293]|uniref:hypothetical protein n=1 Tax=Mesorhizobium sp. M0293 TaxID=2956930 RepID=UPI00333B865E
MTSKTRSTTIRRYGGPVGGWGSAKSVGAIIAREHVPLKAPRLLSIQNKSEGYICVSCACAKPAQSHPLEFCESGAKATAREITSRRADPAFFEKHTLSDLERWPDHDLEEQGRLTHPMRWDAISDKYLPVAWAEGGVAIEIAEMPEQRIFASACVGIPVRSSE